MKYHHTFTMQGSGQFPVDMLRYDQCWPATSDDAFAVVAASQVEGTPAFRTATVTLAKHSRTADPQITHARWASFGWQIVQGSHRFNKL